MKGLGFGAELLSEAEGYQEGKLDLTVSEGMMAGGGRGEGRGEGGEREGRGGGGEREGRGRGEGAVGSLVHHISLLSRLLCYHHKYPYC